MTERSNRDTPPTGAARRSRDFSGDPGSARATWIASAITLAVILWMGSGLLSAPTDAPAPAAPSEPAPVAVAVERSEAAPVTLVFRANGQTLPERDTTLRAQTSGDVEDVFVTMGETIERGQEIARLRSETAEAELAQARQALSAARREFENAETLLERGVATVDRVQQTRTALTQALARLAAAEDAVADNVVTAPFDGRVERLNVDPGEFVQAGAEIGRIVDLSPLTVSFEVPQQALRRISSGQDATVRFITGETTEGTVTFVGSAAASATRTFPAEITIPNEDGAIAAGISADIAIPTDVVSAHFVQPSVVSLDVDGRLGVKTVNDEDVVEFHPIEIVRAEIDGVWVTGMPDAVRLITLGQGFVSAGERVDPQERAGTR